MQLICQFSCVHAHTCGRQCTPCMPVIATCLLFPILFTSRVPLTRQHRFSLRLSYVSPFLTYIISLTHSHFIRPCVYSSSYMSRVHLQQSATVNAVSLPTRRGLHTHASRSSYWHLSPSNASHHSVAFSSRQKRSFFGIGEILQVVANVRTSFRLASIHAAHVWLTPS
jgi:hypothetical protein